jgi:hypothetical protein
VDTDTHEADSHSNNRTPEIGGSACAESATDVERGTDKLLSFIELFKNEDAVFEEAAEETVQDDAGMYGQLTQI